MTSAVINRNLITQVNQDSGSLTSATTVVHKFSKGEHGEYKGVLYNGRGVAVAEFSIKVGGGGEEKEPKSAAEKNEADNSMWQKKRLPMSVQIDLGSLDPAAAGAAASAASQRGSPTGWDDDYDYECGCDDDEQGASGGGRFEVASEGYAVFKVAAGAAGGYAVELHRSTASGRGERVFDSRALRQSDMLAVVLLRPGTYSVANESNGTKAELKVAYPEKPLGLIDPVNVTCGGAIHPEAIHVLPAQGIVFTFETPSRIKIVLVTPEDRARPVHKAPPSRASLPNKAVKHNRRLELWPRLRPLTNKSQPTQA
jgi:hypothetical protein